MEDDEEIELNLGKIKNIFKRKKDSEKVEETEKEIDEDISNKKKEISEDKKDIQRLEKDKEELEELKEEIEEKEDEIGVIKEEEAGLEKEEAKKEKELEKKEKKFEKIEEDVGDIEDKKIDLSKIKNVFKKEKTDKPEDEKEDVSLDIKGAVISVKDFFKGNKWALPVLLIFIAIFFSTFFRMYPADLPVTENWAENSVHNYYRNQIESQVSQQYPNLPAENKQALINDNFQELLKEKKDMIEGQIKGTADQFRSRLQYTAENGKDYTYLLAIDPWLWYGFGKNYLECGSSGCDLRDDGKYYNYRNGRFGQISELNLVSYLGIWIYKIGNIFGNMPLMQGFFLIPVVLIGLSIIPAFFIARKLGGNVGGFFAAMIVAINSALLSRTPAGFSDTDAANIIFPLFIMWFFLETVYSEDWKKTSLFSILGGISFYLFTRMWRPYHIYDFLLAAAAGYVIVVVAVHVYKKGFLDFKALFEKVKMPVGKSGLFLAVSLLSIILASSINAIKLLYSQVIGFAMMKDVAVTKIWPNVLTTVAEFNAVPLGQIVDQMGGNLLFTFAILGIIFAALKKNKEGNHYIMYSLLIAIWFFGTGYSFTKGIRFAILMVPAFAVAFGIGVGVVYRFFRDWISQEIHIDKRITSAVLIALFCLFLVSPIKAAHRTGMGEIPSYNDAWDSTLDEVKKDAEDGIGYITTWWDFGHWFVANDIRVTFDGGNQGERIHWAGKSLIEDNETKAVGILRMLNCGQELPPHLLECFLADGEWEWENEVAGKGKCSIAIENKHTVEAIDILNKIFVLDAEDSEKMLEDQGFSEEEVSMMIKYTKCEDTLPHYYIASEDMVGKAGVWGHFGSWDFEKAYMYQSVKNLDAMEGTELLRNKFNLSEEKADDIYYEVQNTDADRWISPWPSYVGGKQGCRIESGVAKCVANAGQPIPIEVDLETFDTVIPSNEGNARPNSIVYVDGEEVKEKKFDQNTIGVSVILIPEGDGYSVQLSDPRLADSMFTRMFFFEGHGLEHFDLLAEKTQVTGQKIYTYDIDWKGADRRDAYSEEAVEETEEEEVKASHILVKTDSRTDEEALNLIGEIAEEADADNFASLAEEYSEGPSSAEGGDLGWFGRGQMVKEFEEAAFSLEKGKISQPIKTQFGYHIILLEDKRGGEEQEEISEALEEDLTNKTEKETDNSEGNEFEIELE
ncbi:hypothetical protein GF336_05090 [Candidatus Woesearchaeota archaeon]|nr:hypothetical protein [Candidatus Woesearchaeota archaeon]